MLADHDVGWLDVAMHDPFEVRIFECERHLQENLHQAGHREAAQGPGVFSLDELKDVMKRRPLHHGHRVVRELLFGDAHLVDGDDVRMAQLGENLRLFEKTPELPLVDTVSHRLQGDMAPQVLVENEKDFTHAAFAELAEHDVAIHLISRLWDFGRCRCRDRDRKPGSNRPELRARRKCSKPRVATSSRMLARALLPPTWRGTAARRHRSSNPRRSVLGRTFFPLGLSSGMGCYENRSIPNATRKTATWHPLPPTTCARWLRPRASARVAGRRKQSYADFGKPAFAMCSKTSQK